MSHLKCTNEFFTSQTNPWSLVRSFKSQRRHKPHSQQLSEGGRIHNLCVKVLFLVWLLVEYGSSRKPGGAPGQSHCNYNYGSLRLPPGNPKRLCTVDPGPVPVSIQNRTWWSHKPDFSAPLKPDVHLPKHLFPAALACKSQLWHWITTTGWEHLMH